MIYSQKYLEIVLLLENTSKKDIKGIFHPEAYIKEAGDYCTQCQFRFIRKAIIPGFFTVINAALHSPHGFGEHLKQGALITLKNGRNELARAIVLEIK